MEQQILGFTKTAVIIHGMPPKEEYFGAEFPCQSNQHWLPWIQRQLQLKGTLAQTPEMPNSYNPKYEEWKEMFERFPLNEETILIGHSCGAGFIVRYLSENNIKVGKVALIAPWLDPEKYLNTGMFDFQIDKNILAKTNGITIFYSTDDMRYVLESVQMLKYKVKDIKTVEFKNMGHFCFNQMHTDAFPELLAEVI